MSAARGCGLQSGPTQSSYSSAPPFARFRFHYVYPYKGELELDNRQIVLDEMGKGLHQTFVALAYEEVCRDVFASQCRSEAVELAPSRIGSYWHNDRRRDIEIDVMAVDRQRQLLFAGECKYLSHCHCCEIWRNTL